MYPTAQVAIEGAAYSFDKLYTYLIPQGMAVTAGMRVRVPFGRGNTRRTALVVETASLESREGLKPLTQLLDQQPLLNQEGLLMLHYLQEHTFCTWFDAFRLLVPAGFGLVRRIYYTAGNLPPERLLEPEEQAVVDYLCSRKKPVETSSLEKKFLVSPQTLEALAAQGVLCRSEEDIQAVRDETVTMVRLCEAPPPAKPTPKQKAVIEFLLASGTASLKETCYYSATTRAVVDLLCRKGIAEYYDQPVLRDPFKLISEKEQEVEPALSNGQTQAFLQLNNLLQQPDPNPALLHGITGSGKTQVYLRLIREVLDAGKTALVLVPEIALTAQTVEVFHRRFGAQVAVLHSALSLGERMDQWKRIRAGDAPIVVGTRSAVFAPLDRIGLIVLDEEQEHTYKSEQSPRFHARDIAKMRARHHGALLLLASATPSLESYHAAQQGRYHLVELQERFGDAALPDVYIVDMQDTANLSGSSWISNPLLDALHETLAKQEQAILLLNRRGYSTVVKCSSCGTVADCPHCSVAMTYHAANNSMLCHYCGYIQSSITACSHCGSELVRYAGLGTQKLEEELAALLPQARILRVDMDTTMQKFSHQKLFASFAAQEYDIMLGTQMVAKGLNFPAVTLVGVLSADQSLYSSDFRSFERSFSLLTQVVGRGGRGERRGKALIQTWSPENPVIRLAALQDYPAFYEGEIMSRKLHLYPPFCTMAGIGFVGDRLEAVEQGARQFLQMFRETASKEYADLPVRLFGPSPSEILKAAGRYRYKLILKCRDNQHTRRLLAQVLRQFSTTNREIHAFIDMHYDRL